MNDAISDAQLRDALSLYAGLVGRVLAHPERWLGLDDDPPPTAGLFRRTLHAARDRTFGDLTPASPDWATLPSEQRVRWWITRIGAGAGLAAAAPRFAGALADRVPLQAALGASAAGLAVCAVAREHGRTNPAEWVPLLGRVLFDRELDTGSAPPAGPDELADPGDVDSQLEAAAVDPQEPPSTMQALGRNAQRVVRLLWRLARIFLELDDLLDHRPRGGLFARGIAKLPVVGVAGGWLDERGGISKAAKRTNELLGAARPGRRRFARRR